MSRFNLIGPSYASQSLVADCQITRNFYTEIIESQTGKSAMALYGTPGTSLFATLPGGGPLRGQLEINGRHFAVSGPNFCEQLANGTFSVIGQVTNDLLPASLVASPQQLLLAAGGNLYAFQLQTQVNANGTVVGGVVPANLVAGTFLQIPNANFSLPSGAVGNPGTVEYMDGFFVVLLRNSQRFYISTNFDATSWPGLQFVNVSVYSDNVQSIIQSQRRLWVIGRRRSTVYYDSGSLNIFDVDPSGTIENGLASTTAVCRLDNSVFWLDQDERGQGIARRAVGYTPARVSNHAIEAAWQTYPTISDCVVYPVQYLGHSWAVFTFPTAQKTWAYDVATNSWCEWAYWNVATGTFSAHKSQNHALAFGKHLLGDPGSGNLYVWDTNTFTDNGQVIKRIRRSPFVGIEFQRVFFSQLELDVEAGLGPQPPLRDGDGNARGPLVMLRTSRDYSKTWGSEYDLDCGQAGQYRKRVRKTQLGSSKTGMVFELSVTDPVPWRFVEGYLDAQPGFTRQERLTKTYAKVT